MEDESEAEIKAHAADALRLVDGAIRVRIIRLMNEQDLTQTELAEKTGIDRTLLSRLLKGERRIQTAHITAIGRALGLSTAELVEQAEQWLRKKFAPAAGNQASAQLEAAPETLREWIARNSDHITPWARQMLSGGMMDLKATPSAWEDIQAILVRAGRTAGMVPGRTGTNSSFPKPLDTRAELADIDRTIAGSAIGNHDIDRLKK
jgi:transcriptional regulator with XRE-family HTH domain